MGLISGRLVLLVIILFVGVGYSAAVGLIAFHKEDYACYQGKWWYSDGEKKKLWSVGSLIFYYQPMNFDCKPDYRYDPKVYQIQDGLLTPKAN
jgi:hypothetical protein